MADGEGYNILFEGARKNDLAALLTEYTPDQVKAAWSEYLDMHVDAGNDKSPPTPPVFLPKLPSK